MPDTGTHEPQSLPEAHALGSNPAGGAPPIRTTKPSHRNPHQYPQSHPNLASSNLQRRLSDNQFQKPSGEPPFSPPFLHPSSLRTKPSRTPPPLSASRQRYRNGRKSGTRFTIGSSRPNSPSEPEPKRESSPTRSTSPFTLRGFLTLPTFPKVVAILFACCVFVLLKAFLGVERSAEGYGVHAYAVPHPGPRSESSSGSASAEPDTDNPEFRADGGMLLDQSSEDEQPCVVRQDR